MRISKVSWKGEKPATMPKSMSKVLRVSYEAEIGSGHLINFASNYATACRISSDILGFVDIVPNAMILRWDNRTVQCESLSDRQMSK
jgi:hypothetical protein